MPCGGIYPMKPAFPGHRCFHCNTRIPTPDHFCDEWDCFLHRHCIPAFLETEEGQIVLSHKHDVFIEIANDLFELVLCIPPEQEVV